VIGRSWFIVLKRPQDDRPSCLRLQSFPPALWGTIFRLLRARKYDVSQIGVALSHKGDLGQLTGISASIIAILSCWGLIGFTGGGTGSENLMCLAIDGRVDRRAQRRQCTF
jgi:hypothetical protein